MGVSVNIHLGVPTRTCPGFVITKAQLHLNFLLSDYRRACSSGGRGNWLVYSNLATVSHQPFEALEYFLEVKSCCSATLQGRSEETEPIFWTEKWGLNWYSSPQLYPMHFFLLILPLLSPACAQTPKPAQIKVKGYINSGSKLKLPRFFNLVLGLIQEKRQSLLLRYLCWAKNNFGGPTLTEHAPLKTEQYTNSHVLVLLDFWQPETKVIRS